MSLAARAVRGTMFVVVGQYLNMVVNFSATIILARWLGPTDFGAFALAAFFFALVDITGKVHLDFALMQRQDLARAALPTHFVLKLLSALGSLFLAAAVALVLPSFGYEPTVSTVLLILALVGIVQASSTTSWMVLEKELRFARTMGVSVVALIFSSAVAVFLASQGWGIRSLVIGSVVNAVLTAAGMWLASPWRFWQALSGAGGDAADAQVKDRSVKAILPIPFDWQVGKEYLRFGISLAPGAYATIVLLQFDNFLVGSLVGLAALGFYDRAYRLATWPTGLVTHIASRAALPVYAKVQGDRARLSYVFSTTLELIATLSIPLAIVLFVAAPDVVIVLLGADWLPTVPILRLLLGYSVMRPLVDDTGALLTAIGHPRMQSTLMASGAVVLVAVATPLTMMYGVIGTAVGANVALLVVVAVAYRAVAREVNVPYRQILLPPMLGALAGLAVGFAVQRAFGVNELPVAFSLIIKASATLGTYVAVVLLLDGRRLVERTGYVWRLARGG